MKTYYCVTTKFYDNGDVMAGMTDIREAEVKPESEFKELPTCDVYKDWFRTRKEAEQFIKEAAEA